VPEAVDHGYAVLFTKRGVEVYDEADIGCDARPVLKGARDPRTRLFYISFPSSSAAGAPTTISRAAAEPPHVNALLSRTYHEYKSEYDVWHARMAHINSRLMALALPDLKCASEKHNCDVCTRGKLHRHPHSGKRPTQSDVPWKPGEHFSCDLFGPLTTSFGGARYAAFYVDLKSKFVYVKPLKTKDDQYEAFEEVVIDAHARSGRRMRFFNRTAMASSLEQGRRPCMTSITSDTFRVPPATQ